MKVEIKDTSRNYIACYEIGQLFMLKNTPSIYNKNKLNFDKTIKRYITALNLDKEKLAKLYEYVYSIDIDDELETSLEEIRKSDEYINTIAKYVATSNKNKGLANKIQEGLDMSKSDLTAQYFQTVHDNMQASLENQVNNKNKGRQKAVLSLWAFDRMLSYKYYENKHKQASTKGR